MKPKKPFTGKHIPELIRQLKFADDEIKRFKKGATDKDIVDCLTSRFIVVERGMATLDDRRLKRPPKEERTHVQELLKEFLWRVTEGSK